MSCPFKLLPLHVVVVLRRGESVHCDVLNSHWHPLKFFNAETQVQM